MKVTKRHHRAIRTAMKRKKELQTFFIPVTAGLFDFSWTGPNRLWIFPDGSTSTAERPAVTLSEAGTVKLVVNHASNWTGIYGFSDNNTNALYIGSISDCPPFSNYVAFNGCTNATGALPQHVTATLIYLSNCDNIDIDTTINNIYLSVQISGKTGGTLTATGTTPTVTAASATARTELVSTYGWTVTVNE